MFSEVVKQNVGIDVSAEFFDAVFTVCDQSGNIKNLVLQHFDNKVKHFPELIEMVNKYRNPEVPVRFTLEFTGVYHQKLVDFLYEKGFDVRVVNGLLSKRYRESLESGGSGKTDPMDAKALGRLGVERNTRPWQPESHFYAHLKTLTRERYRLLQDRSRLKNRLHALQKSSFSSELNIHRIDREIAFFTQLIDEVDAEIKQHLQSDEEVWNKAQKPLTIKGVGIVTLATVLAETDGFQKITSAKQLLGFAGYHIKHNDSGKHKGESKISKRGNKYIRKAMHLPTLTMTQYSLIYKQKYQQLCDRMQIKMKAVVAIQRKLLSLIYSLWKSGQEFNDKLLIQSTMN